MIWIPNLIIFIDYVLLISIILNHVNLLSYQFSKKKCLDFFFSFLNISKELIFRFIHNLFIECVHWIFFTWILFWFTFWFDLIFFSIFTLVDQSDDCWNLLHFCAKHGLPLLAELLLSKPGAKIALNQLDDQGRTPLDIATQSSDKKLIEILSRLVNDL